MSVKIWCNECHPEYRGLINVVTGYDESGEWGREYIINSEVCSPCSGKGYIVKGCENCYCKDDCEIRLLPLSKSKSITFCTAWEEKDEG